MFLRFFVQLFTYRSLEKNKKSLAKIAFGNFGYFSFIIHNMLSIAHAVSGAFIAAQLPEPIVFIPLAIASHFALDHVAHFDVGTNMKNPRRKMYVTFIAAGADLLIAAILIALIWRQTPAHFNWQIWLGAFCGILPDVLESTELFFRRPIAILQPLYQLHEKVHVSTSSPFWGILPQAILVIFIGLLTIFN